MGPVTRAARFRGSAAGLQEDARKRPTRSAVKDLDLAVPQSLDHIPIGAIIGQSIFYGKRISWAPDTTETPFIIRGKVTSGVKSSPKARNSDVSV